MGACGRHTGPPPTIVVGCRHSIGEHIGDHQSSTGVPFLPRTRGPAAPERQDVVVLELDAAAFEDLVAQALDEVPAALAALVDNLVVVVEDDAPAHDRQLLGLYEGVPLTERDGSYAGTLPDRVTIFRRPILAICDTPERVVAEVRITVVHELAHHFGIDDDRLHDLGYG
ncbi:MAG: metallopeptidase family protein [Actinomycetota bacterium]|nr:MAG: metallopeptidase family protein [Actinomycetota bacterium]